VAIVAVAIGGVGCLEDAITHRGSGMTHVGHWRERIGPDDESWQGER
jgi:hypothetical protein